MEKWVEKIGWIVGWQIWKIILWINGLEIVWKSLVEKLGGKIGLKNCVNKMGAKIGCKHCVEKLCEKIVWKNGWGICTVYIEQSTL